MDVSDLNEKVIRDSKKKVRVFNPPHCDDFKFKYAGKKYVIHSGEAEEYSFVIGKHAIKHLAQNILNKEKIGNLGLYNKRHKEIIKEVTL